MHPSGQFLTRLIMRSPYKFEAPWSAWEFAYHILHKQANLVILSMAWLTRENPRSYSRSPKEPDMETLSYWLARIEPLIRAEAEGEIIVVFANRTGIEEEAVYAGTSAVLGIQAGEVKVYGILGRGEKELLVVDTSKRPQAKLISEPNSTILGAKKDTLADKADRDTKCKPTALSPSEPSSHQPTLDETVIPISPVDPTSHHTYFAPEGCVAENETQHQNLKSSIGYSEISHPPNSPIFKRPESPKSRNASRTRQPAHQPTVLISHDLTNEEEIIQKVSELRIPSASAPLTVSRQDGLANGTASIAETSEVPRPRSAVW